MKLSHSKLNCILNCPMEYYLRYVEGISAKDKATALTIGSAVHWGIEHNTEDLDEYAKLFGTFKQDVGYSKEQLLAESMVHGYMKHKDEIFDKILTYNGKKLKLLSEEHEVFMTGYLKSYKFDKPHEFIGIIDLLLKTDEGYVIIDYKTSSMIPNWDDYLEQLYRYIFLLKETHPETPLIKIGIINLRKSGIRQKRTETEIEFLNRLKLEYDINDEELINYHEFDPKNIDVHLLDNYIKNLSKMADAAQSIVDGGQFYINFGSAKNQYGKSEFYDIFFETPGAEVLYKIQDKIWNEDENKFNDVRDCVGLDMKVINNANILNKFSKFKNEIKGAGSKMTEEEFIKYLHKKYMCDDSLIDSYFDTMLHELDEK